MKLKEFEKICSLLLSLEPTELFENLTQKSSQAKINFDDFENLQQQNDEDVLTVYQVQFGEMCQRIDEINLIEKIDILKLNLIKYFYPSLLILGILGNLLCLLLMLKAYTKERKENRNFSFCFSMICFSDLLILVFGCFREYLDLVFDIQLRSYSMLSCKILFFSVYLFSAFSSYLYTFIAV